jgi:hypothetical protein
VMQDFEDIFKELFDNLKDLAKIKKNDSIE